MMTSQEIFDLLNLQFGDLGLEFHAQTEEGGDPFILIPAVALTEVATFLKQDPRLDFKMCHCVSGVDYGETLASVIHLYSLKEHHKVVLKTVCPKENPVVPSVSHVWRAADWHERESFDLLGIIYEGHPNLKRILLSEDWEGHPLRKDYIMPDDSQFPWEGQPVPENTEEIPAGPTAPGGQGGTLERPQ